MKKFLLPTIKKDSSSPSGAFSHLSLRERSARYSGAGEGAWLNPENHKFSAFLQRTLSVPAKAGTSLPKGEREIQKNKI